MKNRIFAFITTAVLLLNVAGFAAGDNSGRRSGKRQSNALVALLPASDGVATFDAHRFFSDALPKVLAANQPMLGHITAKLDEIESKTGIDLRKFDSVAVGVAYKKSTGKDDDIDPVAIARGDVKASAIMAVAKLASDGSYREVSVGGHTVYVFAMKEIVEKAAAKSPDTKLAENVGKTVSSTIHEIAITTLDDNTFAIGSLKRVTETVEAKSHVDADVSGLLGQRDSDVMTFALKVPPGMSKMLPLDNDELGANIDSIRFVFGSMDVADAGASIGITARTVKPEQAQGLLETLDGLKMLGKAFLGKSKRADQQAYARMIENTKLARVGNDVSLNLLVPQADLNTLVGSFKVK